jgi:hypothetical protein
LCKTDYEGFCVLESEANASVSHDGVDAICVGNDLELYRAGYLIETTRCRSCLDGRCDGGLGMRCEANASGECAEGLNCITRSEAYEYGTVAAQAGALRLPNVREGVSFCRRLTRADHARPLTDPMSHSFR